VHFIGDIHQPLHNEDVALGGNRIHVRWGRWPDNLHHVWDTRVPDQLAGGRGSYYGRGLDWANELSAQISHGKYAVARLSWLEGVDLADPEATAMVWAREANAYVCSTVLPEGAGAVGDTDLGPDSDYYGKAAPVVELQVARAGFRLAAWLDLIARAAGQPADEL